MQSQCQHCQKHFEKKEIANHTKWCDHNPNRGKSKFLTYVTCPECGKETTKQSLKAHLQKHQNEKMPKTPKSQCPECGKNIFDAVKKFCSRSCSAKYHNNIRDYSKVKPGPAKGTYTIFGPPKRLFTQRKYIKNNNNMYLNNYIYNYFDRPIKKRESFCKKCNKLFSYETRTSWITKYCSKECRMESVKYNRGRHKRSYMEISFSNWLNQYHIAHQTEVHFRNTELDKSYFADFVFEDLKLIIELDGSQHEDTVEQDAIRDQYLNTLGYRVLRITHKEYKAQTRIAELKQIFGIK